MAVSYNRLWKLLVDKKMSKADLVDFIDKLFEQPTSVILDNKPSKSADHPTMKPITLCAKLIYNSSHEEDTVFEPFGGSGSTLVAAEQLNPSTPRLDRRGGPAFPVSGRSGGGSVAPGTRSVAISRHAESCLPRTSVNRPAAPVSAGWWKTVWLVRSPAPASNQCRQASTHTCQALFCKKVRVDRGTNLHVFK